MVNIHTNLLGVLLERKINERRLSIRAAARSIGIAHTTVSRLIEGANPDLDTLIAVCKWLGVSPATAINTLGQDDLASKVAFVIETNSEIAKAFSYAVDLILLGKADPSILNEIASYTTYRLNAYKGPDKILL